MENREPSRLKAWSYSTLNGFETCPRRFYLTKVSKEVAEPPFEAKSFGVTAHAALEHRIRDNTPLPKPLEWVEPMINKILDRPYRELLIEEKVALDRQLQRTAFFADNCWIRGVLDFALISNDKMLILDWKTGKYKPDLDQLKLFALFGFHLYPQVERVHAGLVFLKDKKVDKVLYVRDDTPALWKEFNTRVERLNQAYELNIFPAKPSGLCKAWCPCHQCIHHGKYKK